MTNEEKQQAYVKILLVVVATIFVCSCAAITLQTVNNLDASYAAYQAANPPPPVQSAELPPAEDMIPFVYLFAIVAVAFVIYKIFKSGNGALFIFICLAVLAAWFFLASDKNGDGAGDSQIIAVVQPIGDAETDAVYADINGVNSTTNVKTAASFLIYAVALIAIVLGLSLALIIPKPQVTK